MPRITHRQGSGENDTRSDLCECVRDGEIQGDGGRMKWREHLSECLCVTRSKGPLALLVNEFYNTMREVNDLT